MSKKHIHKWICLGNPDYIEFNLHIGDRGGWEIYWCRKCGMLKMKKQFFKRCKYYNPKDKK